MLAFVTDKYLWPANYPLLHCHLTFRKMVAADSKMRGFRIKMGRNKWQSFHECQHLGSITLLNGYFSFYVIERKTLLFVS